MPSSKSVSPPIATIDQQENFTVDCYVRSTVPMAIAETIDAIIKHLHRLCDHGHISNYQITPWPPEYCAAVERDNTREPTRQELVAEFEHWAKQHGMTLGPAFRRREIPPSPLGMELRDLLSDLLAHALEEVAVPHTIAPQLTHFRDTMIADAT